MSRTVPTILAGAVAAALLQTPAYAAPAPAPDVFKPKESAAAKVLTLVNKARSQSRTCGGKTYPARKPLRRDKRLETAAVKFAKLMAKKDFFDHTSPSGTTFDERISAEGYRWSRVGENLAAGQRSPREVVRAWLESPGHCANIMGDFKEIGIGRASSSGSSYGTYWVQDFATPR
jgi:uncharacterized protein YkwD